MTPDEIALKQRELDHEAKAKRNGLLGDLAKFFIGTVILGLLTNFMNHAIQDKRIELEANRNESEYLSKFVGQYLSLPELDQKKEFLEFMITISYSDIIKKSYQNLLDTVNRKMAKKKQLEAEIKLVASKISQQKVEEAKLLEKQIVNGQIASGLTREDVNKKEKQLDNIVKEDSNLKRLQQLNEQVAQIDNSYASLRKIVTDTIVVKARTGYQLIDTKNDEWIKEDYFRIYENNYLAVNELKSNSVAFQMRSSRQVDEGLIANFTLSPGGSRVVDAGDIRYEIRLTRIGAAGRFPLPKAAIYSVNIFKKL